MSATLPLGVRRLPGVAQMELEPGLWGPLTTVSSTARHAATRTSASLLLRQLTAANPHAIDESLLPQPLLTERVGRIPGGWEAQDVHALDNVVDDDTELLDEDLLDLLARGAG